MLQPTEKVSEQVNWKVSLGRRLYNFQAPILAHVTLSPQTTHPQNFTSLLYVPVWIIRLFSLHCYEHRRVFILRQ